MTVKEIVEKYLTKNNLDGLINDEDGEYCCCRLGELFPCGMEDTDKCRAGKLRHKRGSPQGSWYIEEKKARE